MSAPNHPWPTSLFDFPTDADSLDPRKFMPTPLNLLAALRRNYAAYEAPREGRTSIKVTHFPEIVTTTLGIVNEKSDRGNGRHASEGVTLACCAEHGMEALLTHPVALDNTRFTSELNRLKDCDLTAHEIVARQFREFDMSLAAMGGGKRRTVWLPTQLGNNIHGLAHNMGATPGELLMVAVMSALSTQQDFLSDERCRATAQAVGDYLKGYSYRGRFGLAALKVAEEIQSETLSWD